MSPWRQNAGPSLVKNGRYLVGFLATVCVVVGLAWIFALFGQRAYKSLEYSVWRAKVQMVASCQLGDTIIVGDSRALAGLVPAVLSTKHHVTNLALDGGTPVEAFFQLEQVLKCPDRPKRLIIAFSPQPMTAMLYFWRHNYGLLSWGDLHRIRAVEIGNGRFEVHDDHPLSVLSDAVGDWMFVHNFPSHDFASALNANWAQRWTNNKIGVEETLSAQGYHVIGNRPCIPTLGWESTQSEFTISPLSTNYLTRIIDTATQAGLGIDWVSLPISDITDSHVTPGFRDGYLSYVRGLLKDRPQTRIVGDPWPVMQRCEFGDHEHLSPSGAIHYSQRLAPLLE